MTNDEIIALYKQGKSLDYIAKLCGKTPNSVSGIISHAGASRTDYRKLSNAVNKSRIVDYNSPPKGSVALLYTTRSQCVWPYGLTAKDLKKGDGHFVCGKKCVSGKSYCQKHYAMAWSKRERESIEGLAEVYK